MFVFAGLSFCSRRGEIKLPVKEEDDKSQASGLPKTFICVKGRETKSADATQGTEGEVAFNEVI